MLPISFVWGDERLFKIDKVIAVRKGHSLRTYVLALRYYCQSGKKRYYLYYDGETWYVES